MTNIDTSPEAIQAHLDTGARLRAEAIRHTASRLGAAISSTLRSAADALTGDWTKGHST